MVVNFDEKYPYRVLVRGKDYTEIASWCEANFGEFDNRWYKLGIDPAEYLRDPTSPTEWRFCSQEDAVLFSLRWL